MPTTSFEVGSVFTIVDRASPVIERLSREMRLLADLAATTKKGLTSIGRTSFAGLETSLKKLGDQAVATDTKISAALGGLTRGTDAAIASVSRLAREWEAVGIAAAAASRAGSMAAPMAAAGTVAAGGSRRHPPGFMHYQSSGMHVPGGHVRMGGGGAALAGASIVGYGAYEAAQVDDIIAQGTFHLGKNDPATRQKIRGAVLGALGMGFSLHDIGEATQNELRLFKGTPGGGLDVLPEMLRSAGTEARLKGSSLGESMSSFVGLAHMTKQYSPEQIKQLAPLFGFLSTSTPMSLPQIERSFSYAVPMLQSGMGIDPAEAMLYGVAMQRAGVTNSKSGTWTREMMTRAMPGTSLISKMAFKKHEAALRKFGLVDDAGKPTWFVDDKPNMEKFLEIAGGAYEKLPLAERAADAKAAFGVRGAGALGVLADPAVRKQVQELRKEYPQFKDQYGQFWQTYQQNSPMQQGRATWGELQKVLIGIGSQTLPGVVAALKTFESALKSIQGVMPSAPKQGSQGAALGGGMMIGAGAGAIAGAFVGQPMIGAAVGAFLGGKAGDTAWIWNHVFSGSEKGAKEGAQEGAKAGAQKGSEAGTERGARKGITEGLQSLFGLIGYRGGAGASGGGLIRASYVTRGDDDAGGGGMGGTGLIPRGAKLPANAGHFATDGIGSGLNGSAFLAARRARFRDEIANTPGLRDRVLGMMLTEGTAQASVESLFNRSDVAGRTIDSMVTGKFYGPIRHGKLPGAIALIHRDPKLRARLNAQLEAALNGSHIIGGFTDQGMPTDPNGHLRRPGFPYLHLGPNAIKGNDFTDWEGVGRKRAEAYRHFIERGLSGESRSLVPEAPLRPTEIHIHTTTTLDGQTVARNSMKHILGGMNGPAKGARTPDYSSARPVAI